MKFNQLHEWLAWLETCHPRKWDLGLERVSRVADRLQLIEGDLCQVLVAGTNGKGSTVAMMDEILRGAGYSVGTSTSPHLLAFNERICLNGEAVSDQRIMDAFALIDDARADISLTYFEFAALASLLIFRESHPDFSLLEIGLGGRLDAMNMINPNLTIITGIALDHQDWLGNDVETIGREKAGIIRKAVPLVVGSATTASILEIAMQNQVTLRRAGHEFTADQNATSWTFSGLDREDQPIVFDNLPYNTLPLENAAIAIQSVLQLGVTPGVSELRRSLRTVQLAGRYQQFRGEVTVTLDVAHNPQSAEYLARRLSADPVSGRTLAVVAMYADKDCESVLQQLKPLVDCWYFCEASESRAERAATLAERAGLQGRSNASICGKVSTAFTHAKAEAMPGDRILVFGSFAVVAGALELLESDSTESRKAD